MGFPTWTEGRNLEDRIELAEWINQKMRDEARKI